MGGRRIEITREALSIFIQSLPVGCFFSILSFGSGYSFSNIDGQTIIPYNDKTMEEIKKQISGYQADFGGTEIYQPLVEAFNTKNDLEKRIFVLTDGEVGNNQ